jgi:hypothetical protein
VVETRVHTPRRWGEPPSAGVAVFFVCSLRSLRTSWFVVGMAAPSSLFLGEGVYYKVTHRGPTTMLPIGNSS